MSRDGTPQNACAIEEEVEDEMLEQSTLFSEDRNDVYGLSRPATGHELRQLWIGGDHLNRESEVADVFHEGKWGGDDIVPKIALFNHQVNHIGSAANGAGGDGGELKEGQDSEERAGSQFPGLASGEHPRRHDTAGDD